MNRSWPNQIRSRLLRIQSDQVSFDVRGFAESKLRGHLESIGASFLQGYHAALDDVWLPARSDPFAALPADYRGFAFEGAAMGLALCDFLSLRKGDRWSAFQSGSGAVHRYVVHVGLGWALARIPWCRRSPERYTEHLDPLLKWLVLDGFGFHEGFFKWNTRGALRIEPPSLSDYGKRVFDQGLGRSLWFATGADVRRVAAIIAQLAPARRPDLWSGIGLAAAYAGEVNVEEIDALVDASGPQRAHFAQGVAFGAEARVLAGIATENTERICHRVWGMTAGETAELTYTARPARARPAHAGQQPEYESWRSNIREMLGTHAAWSREPV